MKIVIETIPHNCQRYDTVGDWDFKDETLFIRVSETGNWKYECLVGLHEMIEALLCKDRKISEREVTEFDMKFTGKGEPGRNKHAPYRREHNFATKLEKRMAAELFVAWGKYEDTLDDLC